MLKLIDRIPLDQFNDKTPLGELYLLGYASQMEAFYNSKVDHASEDAEE